MCPVCTVFMGDPQENLWEREGGLGLGVGGSCFLFKIFFFNAVGDEYK